MPTPQSSTPGRLLRFGAFEVDLLAGELRKSGLRIRMQEQPFRVLALLLERSGDIVTREELRQRLWPADTFVDFDHSLNTAINKIRDALGDSAATPRYIETLARRGYRFVVPVQRLDTSQDAPKLTSGPQPGATAPPGITTSPAPGSVPIHPELEVPIPHRGDDARPVYPDPDHVPVFLSCGPVPPVSDRSDRRFLSSRMERVRTSGSSPRECGHRNTVTLLSALRGGF